VEANVVEVATALEAAVVAELLGAAVPVAFDAHAVSATRLAPPASRKALRRDSPRRDNDAIAGRSW
jgi:hypothetical protein